MGDWTSLSVKQSTVEKLRDQKSDDITWDAFLRQGVEEDLFRSDGQPETDVSEASAMATGLTDADKEQLIEYLDRNYDAIAETPDVSEDPETNTELTEADKDELVEKLNQNYDAIKETTNVAHELLQKLDQLQ